MRAGDLIAALGVCGLIGLPHLLPLQRVAPTSAAAVWLLALGLRAIVAVGAAVASVAYVPQTALFQVVAKWCTHTVLPVFATHLGISGHTFADFTVILPALALMASLLGLGYGLVRGALFLRRLLQRSVTGAGPLGSTILEDDEIFVAVPNLGPGRILVSGGALSEMDDAELSASVTHEVGHLRRRHRPLLLLGSLLASLGRLLPGTATARREFRFSLERDADEYAVRETLDPLALASAICKASLGTSLAPALGLAGRSRVGLRLEYLVEGGVRRGGATLEWGVKLLVALMAAGLLLAAVTFPALALSAAAPIAGSPLPSCPG